MPQGDIVTVIRSDLDIVIARTMARDAAKALKSKAKVELTGKLNHLSGRLDARASAPATERTARRPSWLTVAIVGAVCSAVVGPILTVIAKALLAAPA